MPTLKYRTRMPRPDDPELLKRAYFAIQAGHPNATAAHYIGISAPTLYEWVRLGDKELGEPGAFETARAIVDQAETDPGLVSELRRELGLGSHALFAYTVKQAQAEFVSENLDVVNQAKAGDKGWLPAMTLLERRRPQDFGRQQRIEVDQHVTVTVSLPPQTTSELLAMTQKRIQEGHALLPESTHTAPDDSDQAP